MKRLLVVFALIGLGYACSEKQPIVDSSESHTEVWLPYSPMVITHNATDIDYVNKSAVLNGEITSVGYPEYTSKGFEISRDRSFTEYLTCTVPGSGLGIFQYKIQEWPYALPLYIRTFISNENETKYGKVYVLNNAVIELAAAGIAVQSQDVGFGTWDRVNALCEESQLYDYDDWRLPHKDELYVLYTAREDIGNFSDNYYWSIDFADTFHAFSVNFFDGSESLSNGNHIGRCVRDIK